MERETRVLLVIFAALAAVIVAVLVGGRVQQRAPEPLSAMVAVATASDPVAQVGPVSLAAGEPFVLHAVLEARSWGGEPVFFTEAAGLRIGGEEIPVSRLRRWQGPQRAKILWFTVEGSPPYLDVASGEELERLNFREVLRAEWPLAWAVPGSVLPSRQRHQAGQPDSPLQPFGTQRYHVRIELFDRPEALLPARRFKSWGSEELRREVARFPAVTAALPPPLAVPSRVFGLPQLEPAAGLGPGPSAEIAELLELRLAFSRVALLAELLERAGLGWEELQWTEIDLERGPAWDGSGVAVGDLVRVGERFVVLAADQGRQGRLDDQDIALDFDRGAAVRRLAEVFTGEGLVEWAPLDRLSPAG